MELIIPTFEIWEQGTTLEDIWKHIARCTRVCYQSTPKNDGETDEEFVKRVILRPDSSTGRLNFDKIHGAMLEHGTVYLYLETGPNNAFSKFEYPSAHFTARYNWGDVVGHIRAKYKSNKYSKVNTAWLDKDIRGTFITTNLRVIYENNWLEDLQFVCNPSDYHIKRVTVSFTTNIGVTREFNRHRVNSMAEESTRYCNYTKPRQISNTNNTIGSSTIINDIMPINGQMRFGLPAWLLDDENMKYIEHHVYDDLYSYCTLIANDYNTNWCDIDYYLFALHCAEYCYNNLIKKGWKPQQAREVLPLATKSQLIHTAFIDDWKHFFALRTDGVSGTPHPNAKLVAEPLKEEFIKRGLL